MNKPQLWTKQVGGPRDPVELWLTDEHKREQRIGTFATYREAVRAMRARPEYVSCGAIQTRA